MWFLLTFGSFFYVIAFGLRPSGLALIGFFVLRLNVSFSILKLMV